ncbi:MAG: hypothetical protein JNK72_13075 [Myxococcales bacterium]|nr:hypothetical protein [Myxococcales bacterium]
MKHEVARRTEFEASEFLSDGVSDIFRRRYLYLCFSRVMVCTVIFGATVAANLAEGNSLDAPTPRLVISIALVIYGLSLGYVLPVRRAPLGRLRQLAAAGIAGDILTCTALAFATGGLASPLSVLYALTTLTAALVLGGRATFWTAAASLSAYGLLGVFLGTGVLSLLDDRVHFADPIEATFQTVVTMTSVLSFTAIGGHLADRLVLADDALLRAEASRANLAALYEDVLRSIPVVLVAFDADGLISSVNPNGAKLLGVPVHELLGSQVRARFGFVDAVSATPGGIAAGDAVIRTTGGDVPVSYRLAPLRDRDQVAQGGILVIEDRSVEEELRAAYENAERFAELGRLAAGLAHEIRNPLGGISGCVELVRESAALDDEERKLLSNVSGDVKRLNDLVTEMLFFARPRAPEPRAVDLSALAREVVSLARESEFARHGVTLRAHGAAAIVAPCDADQIKQVLWNLLRNALQVTPRDGAVDVEVSASAESVVIDVRDRGPGVPAALREKIFDAYVSGTARGAGIGLAIVKRIAEAHHARLSVLDREGGGSTFRVEIPREFGRPRRGTPVGGFSSSAALALRLDGRHEEGRVLDRAGD